ncbi:MAG: hypothetical protein IPL78_01745 [Chloroflexi bacterium]|nr:hypothetical protein [Chloroflexota bacterium]
MSHSLFGHLAFSFSKSPENLATEALSFILNRSHIAQESLVRYLSQTAVQLPNKLRFRTQSGGEDGSIPDLIGVDSQGRLTIVLEAKFWAGLTDNQPVAYIRRLQKEAGSSLIVIAPSRRFPTIWPELLRRCHEAKLNPQATTKVSRDFYVASIDETCSMSLVSWHAVIHHIQESVKAENDLETLSDLVQLQGLCERMDEEAFLPIRSEELTSDFGTRIIQYCEIVDEIVNTLVAQKIASTKNLRASSAGGGYWRYMSIYGHGCKLQFNPALWKSLRATPIWFGIKKIAGKQWVFAKDAKEKLVHLEMEEPTKLFHRYDELLIPLYIPTNVEKVDVVTSLLTQLNEIIEALRAVEQSYQV